MSTQLLNENDFESPGYEFMRSHRNMILLYHKLVALNYHEHFCRPYKCPPIHKYYFSTQNSNRSEQVFIFTCLCAWLIKDKCQMNFDLNPEEYQDIDSTISTILEALELLITPDDGQRISLEPEIGHVGVLPGRLKQGYGPEVIWALNVLADRAIELIYELNSEVSDQVQIIYHEKGSLDGNNSPVSSSYITIGQPYVGGGLTTRPLGSYQIDDRSLLLDAGSEEEEVTSDDDVRSSVEDGANHERVEAVAPLLFSMTAELNENLDLVPKDYRIVVREIQAEVEKFLVQSESYLRACSVRVEKQTKQIEIREKYFQTELSTQLEDFLGTWRELSTQVKRNAFLTEQVNLQTDLFENYNSRLKNVNSRIQSHVKELSDESKLKQLKQLTSNLGDQSKELNLKIGLILAVFAE